MKSLIFSGRNFKELIRDPISWIFCLGFPILMLIIMSIVNDSIPAEAGMVLFELINLGPAIAVFGLTFIMLFSCMLIAGDRSDSFLLRIFTSPMRSHEYIIGYILPLFLLSVGQFIIAIAAVKILAVVTEADINIAYMLGSLVISVPSMIMFIGFGVIFGTILNKNAAPGIASIIISMSGIVGGIWMDIDTIGGTFGDICKALPFYHAVKAARLAAAGDFSAGLENAGIVSIWAVIVLTAAVVIFRKKMKF